MRRPAVTPMRDRRRRAGWTTAALLLGWVLGTAAQLQQPDLWHQGAYLGVAAAALTLGALTWRQAGSAVAILACGCLLANAGVAFSGTGLRALALQAQAINPALEGVDLELTGLVSRMPQRGDTGWRFVFEVEDARRDGVRVAVPPRLQLAWYASYQGAADPGNAPAPVPELRAGDRWRFSARLRAPHGNLNPHGFDYELWLWERGIRATGYVRLGPRDPMPQRLGTRLGRPVERLRQSVRDAILAAAAGEGKGVDDAARRRTGIVAALVTGDQNLIARADWDVFRATGVAHLMSISGLHITMFAWLAVALLGRLWRRSARWPWPARLNPCLRLPAQHAALIGGVLLAGAYAVFSGWGVPAQRTVLMLASLVALRLGGLNWPWWMAWLLACALVVALDPWALLQPGFWLSFVAVGVLFASGQRIDEAQGRGLHTRWLGLLREQWVVTLALTPLSLILFGQASMVGLLANLLAIPWVTAVITPLAFLGMLWAPLWQLAAWALLPLTMALQWLAGLPGASVAMASSPLPLGMAAVAGGLLLALRWPWQWRLAGVPLLLPLLLWQAPRPAPGEFELIAADVGQGSAVIVRTAARTLLYDAGPRYSQASDAGQRVLVPLLRALGERVDMLVLSHRDSDHVGGARAVIADQRGVALLSSIEEGHELQALRTAMRCQAGQRWQWDGVRFEVLHPSAADYARTSDTNAISCVLRVRAPDGATALLPGDIATAQERLLVASQPELRADVLLAPHHGSRTSSSDTLLAAVQARLVLIQSGYRNRFGHPAPVVLQRYRRHGVQAIESPGCGAMRWRSAEPGAVRCERELARRYWHHRLPQQGFH